MAEILITDDDPGIRRVMRATLEAAGHVVTEAGHGGEALANVTARHFDLIVTDMNMPGVDGIELTRILRLQPNAPPIIGITGNDAVNLEVAEMIGAKATLAKPFTPSQLVVLVARVLGGEPKE